MTATPTTSIAALLLRARRLAVFAAVCVIGIGGMLLGYREAFQQAGAMQQLLARTVAFQVEVAVRFNDAAAAREAMHDVLDQEALSRIAIVLPGGRVFAEVRARPASLDRLAMLVPDWAFPAAARQAVDAAHPESGQVELRARLAPLLLAAAQYGVLAALAAAIAAGIVVFLTVRTDRLILRPITELGQSIEAICRDRRFGDRLPGAGIRELDVLGNSLNELLQIVQAREVDFLQTQLQLSHRAEVLSRQAHHDGLTGVLNRQRFLEILGGTLLQARASQIAVLFLDADRLKPVNDAHGHAAGDCVLRAIAARLRHCLRDTDCIARIGGDEFVVMLTHAARAEHLQLIADKIVGAVEHPLEVAPGTWVRPGVSVGWAVYPTDASTVPGLLEKADEEMYRRKRLRAGSAGRPDFAVVEQRT